MVVYEKIFGTIINNQYISFKNKNILHQAEPSYVSNFPLYQRVAQKFKDFLPTTCIDKNL